MARTARKPATWYDEDLRQEMKAAGPLPPRQGDENAAQWLRRALGLVTDIEAAELADKSKRTLAEAFSSAWAVTGLNPLQILLCAMRLGRGATTSGAPRC